MKFAVSALIVGYAAAFAPEFKGRASTAVKSYENSIGAVAPTGFFDPLGISESWDAETFERYQNGEVKNGRVAMLAVIGYVVPEVVRLPGDIAPGIAFKDVPNGIHAFDVVPGIFWPILMFFIGMVDYLNSDDKGRLETLPVDLDSETEKTRRNNEISNGRLAMLAFWELVRHDLTKAADEPLITGLPFLYN